MATTRSQKRWRDKNRLLKSQLNVMARRHTHDALDELAAAYRLRGKGEAVSFSCFLAQALIQRAAYSPEAARMLEDFAISYHRDRDIYAP
ncbi:MAG: hypothetical protein KIT00_00715 [Rhodospirillales bacterium]|nr:hypothetical protein [Rhodospirillales bacterium]